MAEVNTGGDCADMSDEISSKPIYETDQHNNICAPDIYDIHTLADFRQSESNYMSSELNEEKIREDREDATTQYSSPKRRKVDGEGFVTPATPDIPRYSQYFMPYDRNPEGSSNYEESQLLHPSLSSQGAEDESGDSGTRTQTSNSGPPVSASQVLTEKGIAVKMFCSRWSEIFSERESFELSCPERLDKLLTAARTLEETMIRQKEALCQRLHSISQTLHRT